MYLDQEECDTISPEGAAQLDVTEPGVDLTQVVQLSVIGKDGLLNSLQLDILPGQKLFKSEKARLVLGLVVVAILDLTLESSKLDSLVASAWVGTIDNGIARLDVKQVQLYWVVAVNILIREKELLSKSEDNGLLNALLSEGLLSVEPVH